MSNYNSTLQSHNTDLQAILDAINELPEASAWVELPELSNPGDASKLLSGYELIDGSGNVVTGTMSQCNTIYINTTLPTDDVGVDGDIWLVREVTT